ncbi:MAG: acylphosphatase [Candidatus Omnitrophota bacterium]
MKRLHLHVSGYVQGVGFRWYAEKIARKVGDITGFVRNLGDSRVEVVAEGEEAQLEKFLNELKSGYLGKNIEDIRNLDEPCTGQFPDFAITF